MSERIKTFKRDNLTFNVIDTGPIDGTPVVLLHGWPQRATLYDDVTPFLHEAGLRTYCPDQRGYSPGARPRSRFAYRFKALVDDVVALIDQIGGPVHVVGHDWGAAIAWVLAARHPDKVLSLTAVSVGHPRAYIRSWLGSEQARKSWYIAVFQIPVLPERMLSKRGGPADQKLDMPEQTLDRFHREYVGDGAVRGGVNWYRSLPLTTPSDLAKVRVPTTFIWSDNDYFCGRRQAELTERYVTGPYDFIVLHGASHWIPDEAPADLADAIIRRVQSVQKVP
jgi:pimeloyl-ACP methyl ester carboxylesterase